MGIEPVSVSDGRGLRRAGPMPFLWLNPLQQKPKRTNSDVRMYWIFQQLVGCACATSPSILHS
jgi:hypothetical protein